MNKMPKVIQVSPAYRHYKKKIHSHGVIEPTNSRLKWYDISRGGKPIDPAVRDLA